MSVLDNVGKIYMTGIGGAGMCALAQLLTGMGYEVEGSDNLTSDNTERLKTQGITVHIGHDPKNIGDAKLYVYSAAIPEQNCELTYARKHLSVITRAQLFGEISKNFKRVIAVSGTHGKTTVTSLIFYIMNMAGNHPSAVIGGYLPEIGANGVYDASDLLVCEACEFAGTFLQLKRDVTVVLNIDNDHLEYYKTRHNLEKSFSDFVSESKSRFVFSGDTSAVKAVGLSPNTIAFGFQMDDHYSAQNIMEHDGYFTFDLFRKSEKLCGLQPAIPGKHNIINVLAAAAVALEEGVDIETVKEAVESFHGAARRFDILAQKQGVTVADDYAHHPAELNAVIDTAKKMDFQRIIAVFQPFTYSRTSMLLDDFAAVLSKADIAVLCPIMGGREENTYHISSADLANKIPGAYLGEDFEDVSQIVESLVKKGDLVITMGCGNVYKCARKIIEKLNS